MPKPNYSDRSSQSRVFDTLYDNPAEETQEKKKGRKPSQRRLERTTVRLYADQDKAITKAIAKSKSVPISGRNGFSKSSLIRGLIDFFFEQNIDIKELQTEEDVLNTLRDLLPKQP